MQKYIDRNLGPGERVVFEAKMHWVCLLPGIIICIIPYFAVIGIIWLAASIIDMKTTEFGFTNKKLVGKRGLINTKVTNSPLSKIHDVYVKQGLFGKIFGYGTVHVDSVSESYDYEHIVDADNFRTSLLNAIEEYEQEKIRKSAEEMASAMRGSASWR